MWGTLLCPRHHSRPSSRHFFVFLFFFSTKLFSILISLHFVSALMLTFHFTRFSLTTIMSVRWVLSLPHNFFVSLWVQSPPAHFSCNNAQVLGSPAQFFILRHKPSSLYTSAFAQVYYDTLSTSYADILLCINAQRRIFYQATWHYFIYRHMPYSQVLSSPAIHFIITLDNYHVK